MIKNTFDPQLLHNIESMDFSLAKEHCLSLISSTSTKPAKKQALLRDLEAAPNTRELSRIMWNVMLSGEGLSTINSKWQNTFGGAKK